MQKAVDLCLLPAKRNPSRNIPYPLHNQLIELELSA